MKIWKLRPVEPMPDAWEPWFDKVFGFIVAAEEEAEARKYADGEAGEENSHYQHRHPWLDPKQSTCEELIAENEPPGVILRDFAAA